MSVIADHAVDNAANPLDIMEQIVAANEWVFDRRSESRNGRRGPRTLVRLRAVFQLVTRNQRDAFHLRLRPEGAGKAARRAV